ncbi:acyltransferase family protein [Williamsia sp. MIQD14]|uniref:acyltransferase family protein n=1 Tax=Williamsia sp. MIQD14 TaxID=3425703 RepID=UPI003DA0D813
MHNSLVDRETVPINSTPRGITYRPDIEGLRAVAVLAVVLFHCSVPHMLGGYVGVDTFFVISGFLITSLIMAEVSRTGRFSFAGFYARRAKRLLPAAALVIVLSSVAALVILPTLTTYKATFDFLSAILYIANWRLIAQGNDYLGGGQADTNLILHFWSLAVEEQFYLVWPALVVAVTLLARVLRMSRPTAVLAVTIAAVSGASYISGAVLTASNPSLAYMATYTRVWQFGVGALLALSAPFVLERVRPRTLSLVGIIGVFGLGWAVVTFDSTTAYPGWIAAVPTLAVVGIIASGPRSVVGRGLGTAPLRLIGRWSYPFYLWHWPVLVLAEAQFGELSWTAKLLLMAPALALAAATHEMIEKPIMTARSARVRPQAAASVGLTATLVACAVVMTVGTQTATALGTGNQAPTSADFAQVFGGAATANSGSTTPSPIKAKDDVPRRSECLLDKTTTQPDCEFGDRGGLPVVLFGDSHAHQWQTTLEAIAKQRDWRLRVVTQAGCPVPEIAPRVGEKARYSQRYCSDWRRAQIAAIDRDRPAIVFVSSLNRYIPQLSEVQDDWARSLRKLAKSGAKLVYIRDTPYPGRNIPECVSSALDDWSKCSFPAYDQVDAVLSASLRGSLPEVGVVDLNGYLCNGATCPAVRNGTLLYRDDSHLSATAVRLLTPAFEKALVPLGIP